MALGFADAEANVIVSGRRVEQINETAAEIEKRGRPTLRIPSDVHNRASLEALRDATIESFGKVDILVNSAGITKKTPTVDLEESGWAEILDTNLTGTLRACQIFGKHMLSQKSGRIINIASVGSFERSLKSPRIVRARRALPL